MHTNEHSSAYSRAHSLAQSRQPNQDSLRLPGRSKSAATRSFALLTMLNSSPCSPSASSLGNAPLMTLAKVLASKTNLKGARHLVAFTRRLPSLVFALRLREEFRHIGSPYDCKE